MQENTPVIEEAEQVRQIVERDEAAKTQERVDPATVEHIAKVATEGYGVTTEATLANAPAEPARPARRVAARADGTLISDWDRKMDGAGATAGGGYENGRRD